MYKIRRSIVAYIDVHTYGQLWMSPWGYTTAESRHFSRQKAALKTVKEALQVHQNITYEIGSSAAALCESRFTFQRFVLQSWPKIKYCRLSTNYNFDI